MNEIQYKKEYNDKGQIVWADTGQLVSEYPDGPYVEKVKEGFFKRKKPFKTLFDAIKDSIGKNKRNINDPKDVKERVGNIVKNIEKGRNYEEEYEYLKRGLGGGFKEVKAEENILPGSLLDMARRQWGNVFELDSGAYDNYMYPFLGDGRGVKY